MPEEILLFNPT